MRCRNFPKRRRSSNDHRDPDETDHEPQWRRIWDRLDLLVSQGERVLGDASHDSIPGLLDSLSYLLELEEAVQLEFDYAVIALRETRRVPPGTIAYGMGKPWEHDYSRKVVPVPDPDDLGDVTWRQALSRCRAALKRRFGVTGLNVPVDQYPDAHRADMHER